jgi:hypothetical protein
VGLKDVSLWRIWSIVDRNLKPKPRTVKQIELDEYLRPVDLKKKKRK